MDPAGQSPQRGSRIPHLHLNTSEYIDKSENKNLSNFLIFYFYLEKIIIRNGHKVHEEKYKQSAHPEIQYKEPIEVKAVSDTMGYQLLGIVDTGHSVNGTQADYYVYNGGGD